MPEKEIIIEIAIERLRDFAGSPFKVTQDEPMCELIESVRTYGILVPLIVRPIPDGCYQIISGHRRKYAAAQLGYRKLPVIIRALNDDQALVAMVDSNLQREKIRISEKAFAYRMKYDVVKREGKAVELGIEGPYTSWWHMFGWNVFGLLLMGPAVATHRFFGTLNAVEKELNKRSGSAPEHDLSEDFAFFNYNELRLLLDCKYGLKPEHGIEDFETFLNINTDLGPNLASTDPRRASLSLARLVLMYFDDLHSGYIRGSGLYEIDPQAELLYQRVCLGPSIRKMKSTKETYQNARKEVYRAWVPGYEEVDDTAFYYF